MLSDIGAIYFYQYWCNIGNVGQCCIYCPYIGAISLSLANLRQYVQYWTNIMPILFATRVGSKRDSKTVNWVTQGNWCFDCSSSGRRVSSMQTVFVYCQCHCPGHSSSWTCRCHRPATDSDRRRQRFRTRPRWRSWTDVDRLPGWRPRSFEFCFSSPDVATCFHRLSLFWEVATRRYAPAKCVMWCAVL